MRASARSLPRFPDASAVRFLLHLALACVVSLVVLLWMLPSPRPVRTDLRWQPLDSVDFELVDHRGNRVTRAELLGWIEKWKTSGGGGSRQNNTSSHTLFAAGRMRRSTVH